MVKACGAGALLPRSARALPHRLLRESPLIHRFAVPLPPGEGEGAKLNNPERDSPPSEGERAVALSIGAWYSFHKRSIESSQSIQFIKTQDS